MVETANIHRTDGGSITRWLPDTSRADIAKKIFWNSVVDKATGCWIWSMYKNPDGYGQITVDGRSRSAHRVSYAVNRGPIPEGWLVCHRCDNPSCVNPDHLFVGTNADNLGDMARKGRHKPCKGEKHGRAKLTEADVIAIRASQGVSHSKLAAKFGISKTQITRIRGGEYWQTVPANGTVPDCGGSYEV